MSRADSKISIGGMGAPGRIAPFRDEQDIKRFIEKFFKDKKAREYLDKNEGGKEEEIARLLEDFFRSEGLPGEWKVIFNGERAFPDLTVKRDEEEVFWIELKRSNSERIPGNSIIEVGEFLERAGKKHEKEWVLKALFLAACVKGEVRVEPYFHFVETVNVTHSPRYLLNFAKTGEILRKIIGEEIEDLEDFWQEADRIYDELVKPKEVFWKIVRAEAESFPDWLVRDLLRDSGEEAKNFMFKFYKDLSPQDKLTLRAKVFLWVPVVLTKHPKKYSCVEDFLFQNNIIFPKNLRDEFSAGGRKEEGIPRVFFELINLKDKIDKEINEVIEKGEMKRLLNAWKAQSDLMPSSVASLIDGFLARTDWSPSTLKMRYQDLVDQIAREIHKIGSYKIWDESG